MVYMAKFLVKLAGKAKEFREREDGLSLTEYVVTLGLLVVGVITGVLAFGGALGATWDSWATWLTGTVNAPAAGVTDITAAPAE